MLSSGSKRPVDPAIPSSISATAGKVPFLIAAKTEAIPSGKNKRIASPEAFSGMRDGSSWIIWGISFDSDVVIRL